MTEYVKNVDFTRLASRVSHFVVEKSLTSGRAEKVLKSFVS